MKRCWKYDQNIRELVLCFDKDMRKFVIGRELVGGSSRDVQLIFEISGGNICIPLRDSYYG